MRDFFPLDPDNGSNKEVRCIEYGVHKGEMNTILVNSLYLFLRMLYGGLRYGRS